MKLAQKRGGKSHQWTLCFPSYLVSCCRNAGLKLPFLLNWGTGSGIFVCLKAIFTLETFSICVCLCTPSHCDPQLALGALAPPEAPCLCVKCRKWPSSNISQYTGRWDKQKHHGFLGWKRAARGREQFEGLNLRPFRHRALRKSHMNHLAPHHGGQCSWVLCPLHLHFLLLKLKTSVCT